LGEDIFGREILSQLHSLKVSVDGIIIQEQGWDTPVYAKPHIDSQEQERIDFGRYNKITIETEDQLLSHLQSAIGALDVLIINQQLSNSVYSDRVITELIRLAGQYPSCVCLVDARDICNRFEDMLLKMNSAEASRLCGQGHELERAVPLEKIEQFAKEIYSRCRKSVYITRGDRGIVVYNGIKSSVIPGIQTLKKTDPVGAGDTIMAALAASLAAGASLEEAGIIANYAGTVVVQKLYQTGIATGQEILAVGSDPDYLYNPEQAEDMRRACYFEETNIEIIDDTFDKNRVKHVVFDHDGTISTLRQSWEEIMEPVMVKAILGEHYHQATEEEYLRVTGHVRDYIDKSTGIQTILQMQALQEMVSEYGYVNKEDILAAHGYKEIYNQALMELINKRLKRLKEGELEVSDFTVKGSVAFLKQLAQKGIRLYLASGTDQQDVINEAGVLGYADLFQGGIFGAVGDVKQYSKKMVIERIMRECHLQGPQLAVFGDGPVELREARKRSGIAVGIASDEIRRYDLNIEKRERLIKAGSHLVVPDFSQHDKLLNYLLGG